jgi:hypothetical protein
MRQLTPEINDAVIDWITKQRSFSYEVIASKEFAFENSQLAPIEAPA